ncbi:amidase family protein [Pseudomonas sp. St316]|uniref:amidase family protein n=1 Tax=Pseudomonas sp. St316 TaxID=2678257 RepID=UPI001BB451A0|nr:amidase family protein [Pseudomonas sp. St316]
MKNLTDTLHDLHAGRVSATQLVQLALIQAKEAGATFISLLEASALEQAHQTDLRRLHRQPLSPFDGVPIAVKDLFDVKGSVTTAGSLMRSAIAPATKDAAVIQNLRRLGMIVIGKTNLSEFAYSGLGLNPGFGTPVAQSDSAYVRAPGGSSSGSAIAVQRGIVTAALGTDTAGSIRVPAAFNGLAGFKSSTARYDLRGVHPLAVTLDSLGPIARTVEDCRLLDSAMRGCLPTQAKPVALDEHCFVVDSEVLNDSKIQSAVAANLRLFVDQLKQRGAQVEWRSVNTVRRTRALISTSGWLGAIEAWALLHTVVEDADAGRMDPRVRSRLLKAKDISIHTHSLLRDARRRLQGEMAQELGDRILLLPTVLHVAPALAALEADDDVFAQVNLDTLAITMVGSLLDMPGVAMPSGIDESGLPTSVLFSSLTGQDDRLLDICCAIEQAL